MKFIDFLKKFEKFLGVIKKDFFRNINRNIVLIIKFKKKYLIFWGEFLVDNRLQGVIINKEQV